MKIKQVIDEIIGWYGAIAIVGAFAVVSFEVLTPTSPLYQILNGTGALGIIYISFKKKAWQPAALNVICLIIAAISIIRLFV